MAVPALETRLCSEPPWLRGRVEVQRAEPRDTRGAVPGPTAAVCVLEMICEKPRLGLAEAQLPELLERAQAETSGSGFTMPMPCSRLVASIDSARVTIARETSASGSASTIGSPSSA